MATREEASSKLDEVRALLERQEEELNQMRREYHDLKNTYSGLPEDDEAGFGEIVEDCDRLLGIDSDE